MAKSVRIRGTVDQSLMSESVQYGRTDSGSIDASGGLSITSDIVVPVVIDSGGELDAEKARGIYTYNRVFLQVKNIAASTTLVPVITGKRWVLLGLLIYPADASYTSPGILSITVRLGNPSGNAILQVHIYLDDITSPTGAASRAPIYIPMPVGGYIVPLDRTIELAFNTGLDSGNIYINAMGTYI